MALLGKSLSIASVGISCQTAFQIELHADLIGYLIGGGVDKHATPFDWLLCPVASAVSMIRAGSFYPLDVSELTWNTRGLHKPYWPEMGVHFWHEKIGDPQSFLDKQAHVGDSWRAIHNSARRVFIVSNLQNNVNRVLLEADREPIEVRMFWDDVFRLFGALARTFGRIELHVVTTKAGLHDLRTSAILLPWADGRAPIQIHRFDADGSSWAGDSRQWADLFKAIIP